MLMMGARTTSHLTTVAAGMAASRERAAGSLALRQDATPLLGGRRLRVHRATAVVMQEGAKPTAILPKPAEKLVEAAYCKVLQGQPKGAALCPPGAVQIGQCRDVRRGKALAPNFASE